MREHVRNDDGRLQACGWSLPAKYKQVLQGARGAGGVGWVLGPAGQLRGAPSARPRAHAASAL